MINISYIKLCEQVGAVHRNPAALEHTFDPILLPTTSTSQSIQ